MDFKEMIAKRVAKELKDGYYVNLGIGIPNLVPKYLPKDICVTFQSDNGVLGIGDTIPDGDPHITNAGNQPISVENGGSFFDACTAFDMIRGGHLDVTVLGALQVDEMGNLASWMIPNKFVPGMGGAMELATGAKKVFITMEHTSKGNKKIVKKCTLPLTAVNCVDMIFTDMAVIKVTNEGLVLLEYNHEYTIEDIIEATEADLIISKDITCF